MKPEELRIGNLLYSDPITKEPVKVKRLEKDSTTLDIVEPIPLTEEWLLKFGFENVGYFKFWGTRYFHKGICIYFEDNEFRFYYQTNRSYTVYESIHEIQNLYFALTNNELKIK